MSRMLLSDVFTEVSKKIKHEDKIKVLQANQGQPLFYLLRLAYNDIPWALPEGAPPFKEYVGRKGSSPSELLNECRRMYLFFQVTPMNRLRREKLFQDILENLSVDEAELLLAVKDHTLEKKYRLPRKVVEAAFPGLLAPPFDLRYGHRPQQIPSLPGPLDAAHDWQHVR